MQKIFVQEPTGLSRGDVFNKIKDLKKIKKLNK